MSHIFEGYPLIICSVGRFVIAALKHPTVAENVALKVQSFVTTLDDIVAEFEKQSKSSWQVDYIPLTDLQDRENQQWNLNNPSAPIYTLRRIWLTGCTLYEEVDNNRLGISKTDSLATVIARQFESGGGQALRSRELQ